jgi:2-oxoisovalerate dehydrogenase E1 component
MSNGSVTAPIVVRAASGALKSAGPHHSGTYHPIWAHLPGVLVAMPSTPADAKGLMKAALRGRDPVIFLEPKALFATKGEVPQGEYIVPFGVARLARSGHHLTVVTVGRMVALVLQATDTLAREGIECEVIDLRTLVPLDLESMVASLRKTRRLLVVDEGYAMCGVGAEIAVAMGELAFDALDGPVGRLHTEAVAHPFSPSLEELVMPTPAKIVTAVRATLRGRPAAPRRLHAAPTRKARVATAAHPPVIPVPIPPRPSRGRVLPPEEMVPFAPSVPAVTALAPPKDGQHWITMPHGDLTVSEAKVVRWLKEPGETFVAGEVIAELETEKAVQEIEAPEAGRLTEILAPVGATVQMGAALAAFAPK